jgi:nucleotide-binding universal stress UspA family protein
MPLPKHTTIMKFKPATKRNKRTAARSTTMPVPESSETVLRMKRILVTTDFSDESKRALPYAAAFAQRLGGEVALVNVVEPPPRFAGLESVAILPSGDAAVSRVYGGLEALAEQAFPDEAKVTTHVHTGKPFREIIKAASELEADLIVMATHGYTGLKHTFLGSTTERVIRHAPCPVLAVRGDDDKKPGRRPRPLPMQRVVLVTDFSDRSMKAFPLAQSLAAGFGAPITLMHVVEQFPVDAMLGEEMARDSSTRLMRETLTRLTELSESWRRKSGFQADLMVRYGKPFAEIVQGAKSLNASLIVIATHGYTGLKHIYLGSVAERVVRHAHCSVLVVREGRR